MRWRKSTYYCLWILLVLLLISSKLFDQLYFNREHMFAVALIIGIVGTILLLIDAKDMKKQALENMDKYLKDDVEKSKNLK